jgi:hypothetical protein
MLLTESAPGLRGLRGCADGCSWPLADLSADRLSDRIAPTTQENREMPFAFILILLLSACSAVQYSFLFFLLGG